MAVRALCSKQLSPLIAGPPESRTANLAALHRSGVAKIPLLINHVENLHEYRGFSLANPTESYGYVDRVYRGVVAAYLIELVLGIDHLSRPAIGDFLLGSDPSNYPYALGRLTAVYQRRTHRQTRFGAKRLSGSPSRRHESFICLALICDRICESSAAVECLRS